MGGKYSPDALTGPLDGTAIRKTFGGGDSRQVREIHPLAVVSQGQTVSEAWSPPHAVEI